jgi:hypothetical protein
MNTSAAPDGANHLSFGKTQSVTPPHLTSLLAQKSHRERNQPSKKQQINLEMKVLVFENDEILKSLFDRFLVKNNI